MWAEFSTFQQVNEKWMLGDRSHLIKGSPADVYNLYSMTRPFTALKTTKCLEMNPGSCRKPCRDWSKDVMCENTSMFNAHQTVLFSMLMQSMQKGVSYNSLMHYRNLTLWELVVKCNQWRSVGCLDCSSLYTPGATVTTWPSWDKTLIVGVFSWKVKDLSLE